MRIFSFKVRTSFPHIKQHSENRTYEAFKIRELNLFSKIAHHQKRKNDLAHVSILFHCKHLVTSKTSCGIFDAFMHYYYNPPARLRRIELL